MTYFQQRIPPAEGAEDIVPMKMKALGARRWPAAVAVLLLLGLVACSSVTDLRRPKTARVVLSGSPPATLELLTTQDFLVTEGSVQLFDTSTDTVSVPFDRTFSLGVPARFYGQITNVATQGASITMKIFIAERTWYNEQKSLAPGESAEFVYRYDEPAIR